MQNSLWSPCAHSRALLHRHSKQDEFVYVLEGEPTLVTETEEVRLSSGMCAGFPAQGIARHLVKRALGLPAHRSSARERRSARNPLHATSRSAAFSWPSPCADRLLGADALEDGVDAEAAGQLAHAFDRLLAALADDVGRAELLASAIRSGAGPGR